MVLDKGSYSNSHSRQWWEEKFREIQTDPLLRYFWEARNDDEHGLDFVTTKHMAVSVPPDHATYTQHPTRAYLMAGYQITPDLERQTFARLASLTGLRAIYPVPNAHRGKPVSDQSPTALAQLLLTYLEELLVDAGERVT